MEVKQILENKNNYMDLLLLGDEQENMVQKYLQRGNVYGIFDEDLKTICVVTQENENTCEIKNIATYEKYQKNGYGKIMLKYIINEYKNKCKTLLVGTGDNERIIMFYKSCGFIESHIIKDFFIKNYDHKIIEDGKQLIDMIYLKIDFTE